MSTAAPRSTANIVRGGGPAPHNVLTQEEINDIEVVPILDEDGELESVTITLPAKTTGTKNPNFFMVAAANDYNGGNPRMVFLEGTFDVPVNGTIRPIQFMGKFDLAFLIAKTKEDTTS